MCTMVHTAINISKCPCKMLGSEPLDGLPQLTKSGQILLSRPECNLIVVTLHCNTTNTCTCIYIDTLQVACFALSLHLLL